MSKTIRVSTLGGFQATYHTDRGAALAAVLTLAMQIGHPDTLGTVELDPYSSDWMGDEDDGEACGWWMNPDRSAAVVMTVLTKPPFYECGICGHLHPAAWDGDCRDDANRFTNEAVDERYGAEGWLEVAMPGAEEAEEA